MCLIERESWPRASASRALRARNCPCRSKAGDRTARDRIASYCGKRRGGVGGAGVRGVERVRSPRFFVRVRTHHHATIMPQIAPWWKRPWRIPELADRTAMSAPTRNTPQLRNLFGDAMRESGLQSWLLHTVVDKPVKALTKSRRIGRRDHRPASRKRHDCELVSVHTAPPQRVRLSGDTRRPPLPGIPLLLGRSATTGPQQSRSSLR